jgi:hypothetical protein
MVAVTLGPWTPADDFTLASDFSQGVIVPILEGDTQAGSAWQAASSQVVWAATTAGAYNTPFLVWVARGPDDDDRPFNTSTEFFSHGNIFQAAAVTYSGLTEETFQ